MRSLLYRGKGIVSWLIRWQTRSQYSHAALLFSDGLLVESMQGYGVRVRALDPKEEVDQFEVKGITAHEVAKVREFALGEVGHGYDYWAIVRFISRNRMPDNERWFCSEFDFAALRFAGIKLLERIEDWAVSPALLALSPLLKSVEPQAKPVSCLSF